jgi:hypothetical protein
MTVRYLDFMPLRVRFGNGPIGEVKLYLRRDVQRKPTAGSFRSAAELVSRLIIVSISTGGASASFSWLRRPRW